MPDVRLFEVNRGHCVATVATNRKLASIIKNAALLMAFPPLFVMGAVINNYAFIYTALVGFLVLAAVMVHNYLRIFIFYLTVYLTIGLLNISTWRGYVTVETLSLYAWSMYALVLPILVLARRRIDVPFQQARQQDLVKLLIICHISIVFLAVLFVYGNIGNVLIDQHLRFRIPTAMEYVIKSALPIAGVLPFLKLKWPVLWLLALVVPPVMIGSRGTAVIGIVAYVIVMLHRGGGRLDLRTFLVRKRSSLLYGLSVVGIISGLFYLRRGSHSDLAAVDVIMNHYFDYDNALIRMILPFYLGFKETIGLTTIIISDQVINTDNPYPLIYADLLTLLPGENLAAGESLSRIFGSTQDGGLTPGLLGGIYIDYGLISIGVFAIMGLILCSMQRSIASSPYFIIIYAQVITQAIHLFHRGFLKPEYITSVLIAAFYYMLCRNVRAR